MNREGCQISHSEDDMRQAAYETVRDMLRSYDSKNEQLLAVEQILEACLDATDLKTVLASLAGVCLEKSEHLAGNWQEDASARKWTAAAARVASAGDSKAARAVSWLLPRPRSA